MKTVDRIPIPAYNRSMTLLEFDQWIHSILPMEEFSQADSAINGIQIGEKNKEIRKIAFAVDASVATMEKAISLNADMLFVHHGLFWGRPLAIRGSHYQRVSTAIKGDLSLYAVHLPLDQSEELGNNIALVRALELEQVEPFGTYKGKRIGWKGRLPEPETCDVILRRIYGDYQGINLLTFGKDSVETVAIVSGGAAWEVEQAVEEGIDLFITGEPSHQTYHYCREQKINVLAAGHYNSETFGVKLVAEKVKQELQLETTFIDMPTGL